MTPTAQRAIRARGLARQATEARLRAQTAIEQAQAALEKALESEKRACLEALHAEHQDLQEIHGELSVARLALQCAA